MGARKRKKRKKAGRDKAASAPAADKDGPKTGPSVMQFLEKLGGAPAAPRRATPAKGLLGDIKRQDLVDAGRIDADSPEGPPADPHPTGPVAVAEAEDGGPPLQVEVSTPEGQAVGRREPRKAWREVVRVASVLAGQHRAGRAGNLSTSGIFIETTHLLDIGDPLVLAFPTEGGAPLNVSGRVRWVTPFGGANDAQPGMGIEFVGLDPSKRSRLGAMLEGLPVVDEQR